jgi:phospholipid transport system substrate-binding protein
MCDHLRGRSWTRRSFLGRSLHVATIAVALCTPAVGARAEPAGPREVVATFQDRLLATMKEGPSLGFEGRYERLLPALEETFDLEQMTRIVVGGRWTRMSKVEQEQVVALFRQFSVSTYASEFTSFNGQRFEIGGEQVQAGIGTIVKTRLVLMDRPPVELNYLLREAPAGWRIVDVYLAGTISELARRRDEFGSIIRRQGIEGLIAALKRKNEELAGS